MGTIELFEDIFKYLESENPVSGLSIAIKSPQINETYTWGNYSTRDSEAVIEGTVYDLASITKLYTTLLILKLQDEKKINIQDSCGKYLSIFRNSELKIIDLLTHKANFNINLQKYREKYKTNLKYEIYKIEPPKFKSEEVLYENITFIYLGRIIEIVKNDTLGNIFNDMFIENNLEETYLGLENQTLFNSPPTEKENDFIIKNITHDETARLLGGIAGNAGVFSSARDLVKFGEIWIKNDSYKKIAMRNYNLTGKLPQGLGWWNRIPGYPESTPNIFSHTGFTGGLLFIHCPSSTICAMLTNRTYFGRDNNKHQLIWKKLIDEINK